MEGMANSACVLTVPLGCLLCGLGLCPAEGPFPLCGRNDNTELRAASRPQRRHRPGGRFQQWQRHILLEPRIEPHDVHACYGVWHCGVRVSAVEQPAPPCCVARQRGTVRELRWGV